MDIVDVAQYIWLLIGSTGALSLVATIIGKVFTSKKTITKITNGVTDKIITKEIKVDLTAVTQEQFDEFRKEQEKTRQTIQKQSELLKAEGVVIAKMKMATNDERQAIVDAINNLDEKQETTAVVDNTQSVVVAIEPVQPVETKNQDSDLF